MSLEGFLNTGSIPWLLGRPGAGLASEALGEALGESLGGWTKGQREIQSLGLCVEP